MFDYDVLEESCLEKIGVLCDHCQTETVFALATARVTNMIKCPNCNQQLLPAMRLEALKDVKSPLFPEEFTWINLYKWIHEYKRESPLRFYFRKEQISRKIGMEPRTRAA